MTWSTSQVQGQFGELQLNAQTGQWQYHLNNALSSTDSLNEGERHTEQFVVTATDSQGHQVNSVVAIEVEGSNDQPKISGLHHAALNEQGGVDTATGQLLATDPDHNDTATWSIVQGQGQFGQLVIVPDSGQWQYHLNNQSPYTQALNEGDKVSEQFIVKVTDSSGQSVSQVVTIDITGSNQAAQIQGVNSATLTEDKDLDSLGALHAKGLLNITDPDNGQAQFNAESLQGQFGTLSIDNLGQWTYTADNAQAVIQGLKTGESITDTLLVHSVDGTEQKITVTINGTDDKAVITGTSTASLTEDKDVHGGQLRVDGALNVTDADNGQAQFNAESLQGQFGTLSIDNLGHWFYTADNSQAAIQGLKTGESITDTLLVHSVDGTEQKITVTINGTDDKAVVGGTSTASLIEDKDVHSGQLRVDGALNVTDADNGQAQFNAESLQGQFGTLSINDLGHWTYTADNTQSVIQGLKTGESLTDTLLVHSVDGTEQKVTVTINGTDDKAVITGTSTASLTEDKDVHSGQLRVDGALSVTDADNGQAQFNTESLQGQFGTLSIDNLGHWTYTADNAQSAIQGLKTGESLTDTLLVHSVDGTEQKITVTINGAEDKAVITGTSTASLTEDKDVHSDQLRVDGALNVTDADSGQAQFSAESLQGQFGTLSIDNLGHWSYTADNTQPVIQGLKTGESITDTLLVHSVDGTEQKITVTINGTDDKAVISGTSTATQTEDKDVHSGQLRVDGAINVIDADNGQAQFNAESLQGQFGTLSINDLGHWTYTADNSQAAIQGLKSGESLTDTLLVHSVDGTEQKITVTINGTDDKAVIAGTSTASLTEDKDVHRDQLRVDGALSVTDPDRGQSQFQAESLQGSFGTLTINNLGHWTYTADNSQSAIQGLKTGESLTDTLLVHSIDGTEQKITVTINGTDDKAIITDAQTDTNLRGVTEDRGYIDTQYDLHYEGKLNIQDPDKGEGSFDPNIGPQTYQGIGYDTKLGGHILLMRDGHYTYTLDNRNIQNLAAGETQKDSAVIRTADGTTHTIELTVHGTNDRPTIAAQSQSVVEGGALLHGQMLGQDIDHGATLSYSAPQIDGLTLNSDGSYSFDPSHASYQSLAAGATKILTIPVTVKDEHNASSTRDLTITITGVNNSASITGVSTGNVHEGHYYTAADGSISGGSVDDRSPDHMHGNIGKLWNDEIHTDGHLAIVDADTGESHAKTGTYYGTHGHVILQDNGDWSYYVSIGQDATGRAIDHLGQGESLTDTVTVKSADGTTHDIIITIHGDNDRPYCSSEVQLNSGKEDLAQTLSAAELLANTVDVDANDAGKLTISNLHVDHGSIQDNQGGTYTFTPEKDYNGQVHFSYDVKDAHGGITHTGASTILIATPDGAIISEVTTEHVIEDGPHSRHNAGVTTELANGQLQVIDPDSGEDKFQYSQFGESAIHDPFGGMLRIDSAGNWGYSVNNAALQHLAQGQTETVVYRVHSYDGTAYELHIDVVGTNDAPTVTQVTLSNGTEDTHYQMQARQFGFTDVDTTDTLHSISITDLPDPAQGLFVLDGQAIHANQVIATSDISKLQFVPAHNFNGDVNFSYTVSDGRADSAKVTNTLHIDSINDTASIDGKSHSSTSASITEDSATSVISGQLSLIDPDAGEDKFAANTQITGLYGQLTLDENGSWHYALNNASPAVNGLNAGQQLTDTLTITSPDGSASQTIAITIHGHTDTPTLQLQEAGTTQGLDLYAGIQGNQISQLQYSTDGVNFTSQIPAGFSLAADGHTLEVDPAHSAYDHLANGAQHKIWVNYQLQEGSGNHAHLSSQQAQVVISGTSDKPVIHSFSANSDQYSGPVSGNLLQGATDIDDGSALILQDLQFKDPQTHHYITVHTGQDVSITGVGQIHIATNGDYRFTPEPSFTGDVPEFIYRVVDTHGDYKDNSQNTLNIHINANHQPTIQTLMASTAEDTDYQFNAASFSYQDSDNDTLARLTITQLPDPADGHLLVNGHAISQGQTINANDIDHLLFRPAANFNGDAHFSYVANDGHQDSAAHTAVITVTAVNDLPVLTINQTSHTQGSLIATDVDTGDTHTFSAPILTGSFGSLSVDPDSGAYVYTQNNSVAHMNYNPATATYSGVDVFEVKVSDNHGGTASQFISFNVQATLSSTAGAIVITSSVPTQPVVTDSLPSGHIVATTPTNQVSIDLSTASDTGKSHSDDLTSDVTPTITGHTDIPFSRVTIYDGNNPVGHALSDAHGHYSVTLSTLTDGNHSLSARALAPSSMQPAVSSVLDVQVDTQASTSIHLDPITADNVINAQESHTAVNVTGNVGGDAHQGDVVTLTLNQQSYTTTVNSHGQFSIAVAGSELASNSSISASVTTTDNAGNTAHAAQTLHYDTDIQVGRPSISFESPGSDNLYSKTEIAQGHAGTITATVHAAADAKVGEHLNINGVDHLLDANTLAHGIEIEVAPSSIVKAIMTDEHGNVNSALNMAAGAKPEPIVVTAPPGSHHIGTSLGVPTPIPGQTPVPVAEQGWKILVNGHYQTSYTSQWGTLTIDPKTGQLSYQEHGNTHTGPHGSAQNVGVHEDRFEVALQGSHHDDVVMHVQVSILSHGPGHSGKLTLGSEVLDMTVTPVMGHQTPSSPALVMHDEQVDPEVTVNIDDQIIADDSASHKDSPLENSPLDQDSQEDNAANSVTHSDTDKLSHGDLQHTSENQVAAPIDHYLNMVGMTHQDIVPPSDSTVAELPQIQVLSNDDINTDMLDVEQSDSFDNPLLDDEKHQQQLDLASLDDSTEPTAHDPVNDDDLLHQALNDMHNQV
ncbi:hypothetical protein TUM3792_24760 [Shewanella sp. MBTL60-007]|nr:hypothetical protein TUM3792_24760 [Shewanella sp. MBTL60-007]